MYIALTCYACPDTVGHKRANTKVLLRTLSVQSLFVGNNEPCSLLVCWTTVVLQPTETPFAWLFRSLDWLCCVLVPYLDANDCCFIFVNSGTPYTSYDSHTETAVRCAVR